MKNKKFNLIIAVCFLLLLVSCTSQKSSDNENQKVQKDSTNIETIQKSSMPTLFIHGYSGGNNSFGRMIKRMERNDLTKKELILTISAEGEVKAKGKLTSKATNPSVQVLFEDNKNNEWNQAEWIKYCLAYMQTNYDVTHVNLVGHSMGGASSLRYLTTFGDDPSLPKVNKFIGIAAPFNNFVELSNGETIEDVIHNGPTVQSDRLNDYITGSENISKDMSVLIIAGDVEDGSLSDEAVPVADALSVISLFKEHGNQVQEKIFYGKSAQHSQLHENIEVDQLVADFLWK
ncbi:alpha/beta hydrolase [Enterococcus caccae]|uniref:Lipoprotein n=1 Tax=Enterococcus caccae ATCC BAA-1240 TaxID=1158612 RepID=R3W5A7_9ENTE|nr:alpha/beta hydrolase [Enterococcus caccae]EOL42781.1 hypothetical protein UC7_03189 [Enterococcus caccae ATCC BAA-1240]EOT67741.1 hypothetical protein I580_00123 [Enterococcus caccae ATCC BAA-1240]OJG28770.1 hypothetical protein RU98_GL000363 [Enterococcus caccae]